MKIRDYHGLTYSGANHASLENYGQALRQLQCYIEDPVASVDQALAESQDFVMAHVLKAYLHLLGTEPAEVPVALASQVAAAHLGGDARECGHIAAVEHLVAGRWHQAGRVLEDVAI
ncbi:MAG: tetratricopeptide repeat protein, partial [Alphaproteobacteria bacterium]|nr:tetratricopeptide repeat protein [Alphaproteobacteria bacterium]